jgi:DNA-binding transcriptional ArsR family regulator
MSVMPSLDEGLIKAFANPLRWRIMQIVIERGEASPVELARLLDQPLATVSHHVRVLRDLRCVELTRTEPRRGAVEHYYRALVPAFLDDEQWKRVPAVLRRGVAGQIFRRIFEEAAAAGAAGAFDAPGAHLDRLVVELDDRGWRELSELLTDALKQAQAIQDRSDARRDDDGPARTSELALLHFEVAESIASPDPQARAAKPPKRSPRLP